MKQRSSLAFFVLFGFFLSITLACGSCTEPPETTPEPQHNPPSNPPADNDNKKPEVLTNLKEKLFVSFGTAGEFLLCDLTFLEGDLGARIATNAAAGVPTIVTKNRSDDSVGLCLFGYQIGEEIMVELLDPEGGFRGSGRFVADVDDEGLLYTRQIEPPVEQPWVGWADEGDDSGIPFHSFNLWMPLSLPHGDWTVIASSPQGTAEAYFQLASPNSPTLHTLPSPDPNPFEDNWCGTFDKSDTVFIFSDGWPPGIELPVAIYRATDEITENFQNVFLLVDDLVVTTDNNSGAFAAEYQIDPTLPSGRYYVMGVDDPDRESLFVVDQDFFDCFEIR